MKNNIQTIKILNIQLLQKYEVGNLHRIQNNILSSSTFSICLNIFQKIYKYLYMYTLCNCSIFYVYILYLYLICIYCLIVLLFYCFNEMY